MKLVIISNYAQAQFLMDMLDTTRELGRSNRDMLSRFDHIRISRYRQLQCQVASAKGVKNYSGGDFTPESENRFMLRRGPDQVKTERDLGFMVNAESPKKIHSPVISGSMRVCLMGRD